jgi:GT2 family glycosyltransferase
VDPGDHRLFDQLGSEPAYYKSEQNQLEIEGKNNRGSTIDFIISNGGIHYKRDIICYLKEIHNSCSEETRLVITYYSSLWRPLIILATYLGLREKLPETNWVAHEDMDNFLRLSSFETVRRASKILLPVNIPILSDLINRYLAPLPVLNFFNLINILIAKPIFENKDKKETGTNVSIVVPARNEAGHIEDIIKRLPQLGSDDELIFVEGGSSDNTWETIQKMAEKYGNQKKIIATRQDGMGKGDAVRKGFSLASKDILMILDADMTVPPENLPQFYEAITSSKGEFINGSRLVYPMEKEAMHFFNILGNKFFAMAFSFVLGQRFKDTLCGTKVLTRKNYLKIAKHRSFFGDFDPFGDFDLLFGAARLCLKIIEVPITYRQRMYGETNISRWRHGAILFRMLQFAARKIKFV